MEIGDIISTSGIGMIVEEEENENDDLLVAMDGKNLHDDDTIYIMENEYQENEDGDDDENRQYIVEDRDMEQQEEESEDLYNCNACGMNFSSIDDHIQRYHSNQDVILDVNDTSDMQSTTGIVKCEPPEYINDVEDDEEEEEEDGEMMYAGDDDVQQIVFVDVNRDGKIAGRTAKMDPIVNAQQKETYTCNRCSQTFSTLRSLSSHILGAHPSKSQTIPRTTVTAKHVVRKAVRKTKEKAAREKNSEESESDVNERSTEGHTCEQCKTVFQSAKSLK